MAMLYFMFALHLVVTSVSLPAKLSFIDRLRSNSSTFFHLPFAILCVVVSVVSDE